jgi:hypothetical protein
MKKEKNRRQHKNKAINKVIKKRKYGYFKRMAFDYLLNTHMFMASWDHNL